MNKIIELLNDYLVLKEYDSDKAYDVWYDLVDAVQDDIQEAEKLTEYASDFANSFKELRELGVMKLLSPANIRIYIGEAIHSTEDEE